MTEIQFIIKDDHGVDVFRVNTPAILNSRTERAKIIDELRTEIEALVAKLNKAEANDDDNSSYFENITHEAASDLLEQHGIDAQSSNPLVDFGYELGGHSQEWTYEAGLEALVREAVLLDRENRT